MLSAYETIEKIDLEVIQVCASQKLSRHELYGLQNCNVSKFLDHLTDNLVYTLTAYVLGERQSPIHVGTIPTSWWQMLKREHFPEWFCKWFPVKTKDVVIEAKTLYPDLKISIPINQSRVTTVFNKAPDLNFYET